MSNPSSASSETSVRRPWYRLHFSSWLVLVLALALGGLFVLPGEEIPRGGWVDSFPIRHGWPMTFMRRSVDGSDSQSEYAWCLTVGVEDFRFGTLVLDFAVVALGVAAIVGFWEYRRRKRRRGQFSLRTLLIMVTMLCICFGWWTSGRSRDEELRLHLKGVSSIFAINAGLDRVPRFPLWLCGLVGDEKLIPIGINQPRDAVVGWYAAHHENLRYLVERFPERIGLEYSELKDPSDIDLERLSEFKSLQWLHAQNASERVLSRLCNGRNLKGIKIESYDHVGSMNWTTPKSWRISDRGLECLAKNSALEYVLIKDTSQLSDLGLAQLRDLTKLTGL
jgi:hypothetical protein